MRFFNYIGAVSLYVFRDSPRLELVAVMIVAPTIVNVIQFWWIDSFIQLQNPAKEVEMEDALSLLCPQAVSPPESEPELREKLLAGASSS